MRRVGLILIAIGVAGFLLASSQKARYATAEGTPASSTTAPAATRRARDAWESARWLLVGTGVIGLVFTALPGRRD
jgi:hypothetical protein